MKKNQGFILLITLLIISVISVLLLASFQHVLLYYKVINRQEALHKNFYNLEDVAKQLSEHYTKRAAFACVNREESPARVLYRLLHHEGCAVTNEELQYEYLIEDLGEFPCLVGLNNIRRHATHHQRLSIVQFDKGIPLSFLQIRLVVLGGISNCLTKEHIIPLGISSWRYVASL